MGTTRRSSMPDDPFVAASITLAAKRPNTVFRCCLSLCFATDGAENEDDEPLPEGEDEARGRGGNAGGAASSIIATNVSRYLSLVCVCCAGTEEEEERGRQERTKREVR